MTIEEAKEYMGKKLRCSRSDFALCEQYRACKGCPNDVDLDLLPEVMEIAIEALEKQIPKKPIFVYFRFDKSTCAYCPSCDHCFGETKPTMCMNVTTMKMLMRNGKMCSCGKCGQRIDFTEEGAEE